MVYKIGNVSEIANIPIKEDKAKEWIYHFTQILEGEYGAERDIDVTKTKLINRGYDIMPYFTRTTFHSIEIKAGYTLGGIPC